MIGSKGTNLMKLAKNGIKLANTSASLSTTSGRLGQPKSYETLSVTVPKPFVYHVQLNRPQQRNAVNHTMWLEFSKCFQDIHEDPDCRSVVLSGSGFLFCAGLDLKSAMEKGTEFAQVDDPARKGKLIGDSIKTYQDSISALERCSKPVIAVTHSGCIGAGINLVTSADVRYCTADAWFQIKEVVLGLAADVGVLQRMQKIVGNDSLFREVSYTGRKFDANEALSIGLVSKVFPNKESMIEGALLLAEDIAAKSPVAVQGTKINIVYSRDHGVQEGLDYMRAWNQLMLQSEDFLNATVAVATKQEKVTFSKL